MEELIKLISTLNNEQVECLLGVLQDDDKATARLQLLECMKEIAPLLANADGGRERYVLGNVMAYLSCYDDVLLALSPNSH